MVDDVGFFFFPGENPGKLKGRAMEGLSLLWFVLLCKRRTGGSSLGTCVTECNSYLQNGESACLTTCHATGGEHPFIKKIEGLNYR